jgi:hypothetical protein
LLITLSPPCCSVVERCGCNANWHICRAEYINLFGHIHVGGEGERKREREREREKEKGKVFWAELRGLRELRSVFSLCKKVLRWVSGMLGARPIETRSRAGDGSWFS